MKVREVYEWLDRFAPFSTQCNWDNSGLLLGDLSSEVHGVLFCLDVTKEEAAIAEKHGADLIISHHPVIFHPVASLSFEDLVSRLIRAGIQVISAHTNLDKAPGGVNDLLCELVGFSSFLKCDPSIAEGCLNIGTLSSPLQAEAFADLLHSRLGGTVQYVGCGMPVKKVAVCCGSGGEFFREAKALGCDALLTGEAKYHDFTDACALGISLFSAGHFETENGVCEVLKNRFSETFPQIPVFVSDRRNPIITVN